VTADELIAHVAGQLASFKKPRSVDFVESLPIGGTGKILKRELRASFWEGTGRKV
jgi:acyl-CoA synthetase (AMP-forming)/AMP-acid ligase II